MGKLCSLLILISIVNFTFAEGPVVESMGAFQAWWNMIMPTTSKEKALPGLVGGGYIKTHNKSIHEDWDHSGQWYGNQFAIRTGGNYREDLYYVYYANNNPQCRLEYKDNNGNWRILSDDDGMPGNFAAVIYVPGRLYTSDISLAFVDDNPWQQSNDYSVWYIVTTTDPEVDWPYLVVDPDGTVRKVTN